MNRKPGVLTAAAVFRCLAALLALALLRPGWAQVIERVEVLPADAETEIRIHFATTVQYTRHFPLGESNAFRIFFRITGGAENGLKVLTRETHKPPTGGMTPAFTVTYPEEAETIGVRFERPVRVRVRVGADNRSISLLLPPPPAPAPEAAAPARPQPPAGAPAATPEIEKQAVQLMGEARAALDRKEPGAATDALNRLLNLPPNSMTEQAQALIGDARAQDGEYAKARAEYELYLKLYPQGAQAERVRKSLAALPAQAPAAAAGRARRVARPAAPEFTVYGGLSQYYYRGASKFDATLVPPTPGLKFDQISLTSVDQSALVSNLDVTARYRRGSNDERLVIRDTHTKNFLPDQADVNRLSALYFEHQDIDSLLFARLGRQPGTTGGLLGRFDGAWGRVALTPAFRLNVLAGSPVEFFATQEKRVYGTHLDIGPLAERWNGNVFLIEQRVDGYVDRRAAGGELRYFDATKNLFALLDYDLIFRALNIFMAQGNWTDARGTTYTMLLDRRKVPVLQLTNALPGEAIQSVKQLIEGGRSEADLRRGADALTPTSSLVQIGFTHPLTQQFQFGADFRVSNVSATGASGTMPAAPGTGNIYVYSGQLIRTGLLAARDTGVANVSYIDAPSYRGQSWALNHVLPFREKWRLDSALRYYTQRSDAGAVLKRFAPTFKLAYQLRQTLLFEIEAGAENTTSDDPTQSTRTQRQFFNLGFRWDFI
ncbi:MAG: hypothetical protein Fur0034_07970 [Desulfuromonadia bacterium]